MKNTLTILVAVVAIAFTSYAQTPGTWTATGSMNNIRSSATATLLKNGKVLIAGGVSVWFNPLSSAELYDPTTGIWTSTGSMITPRAYYTATLLPDGRVLVAGGYIGNCLTTTAAEIYNPNTETWTATGSMQTSRGDFTSKLISSGPLAGQVLVTGGSINSSDGGCGGDAQLESAELYDPSTELWSFTGSMINARYFESSSPSTILSDGSILVVGGWTCCPYHALNEAELYDPINEVWIQTNTKVTSAHDVAVLLTNGKVLVAGGNKGTQPSTVIVADAEVFNPTSDTWSSAESMTTPRGGHTLTSLDNGQILAAGGVTGGWGLPCNDLISSELYDPASGSWALTGNMNVPRNQHTATLLSNGQVLVAGGHDCAGNILSSAELYTPLSCTTPTATITPLGNLDICTTGIVHLKASTGNNYTYQWNRNNIILPGATNKIFHATQTGNYRVKISSGKGCNAVSKKTVVYTSCKLAEDEEFISAISLYPNPTAGIFMLDLKLNDEENSQAIIQVLNMLGQVVYDETTSVANGVLQKEIQLSDAAADGMYLVKVTINDSRQNRDWQVFTSQINYQKK